MPGATGRLALPYPVSGDAADVPKDVKALADRVDLLTSWIRQADIQAQAVTDAALATSTLNKLDPPVVTALPGAPAAGDRVWLQTAAMKAVGRAWRLRYDPTNPLAYDWIFEGGGPLLSYASPIVASAASFMADAAVSLALPVNGIYLVRYGAGLVNIGAGQLGYAAVSVGGGAPSAPADATTDKVGVSGAGSQINYATGAAEQEVTYTGPGNLVRLYHRATVVAAQPCIAARWLSMTPIALG
jgi:hypothetical protein